MKNTIIVGSGAVAAELTSYIENSNPHLFPDDRLNILGYLENKENIDRYWTKYKFKRPVIDDIQSYRIKEGDHFIVAISNIQFRQKMIDLLQSRNAVITGFIHHSAIVAETAVLGTGNIVYPHCIVGPNTIVGDHNLVTSYSFISHDCSVGNNNFFATAGISGHVKLGNANFLGIRATVLPDVSIGDRNVIQAGMIVDKPIGDDSIVFHRFKEKIIATNNAQRYE